MVWTANDDRIRDAVDLAIVVDDPEQIRTIAADFFLRIDPDTRVTTDRFDETVGRYGEDFVETLLYFLTNRGYLRDVSDGTWRVAERYDTCVSLLVETWYVLRILETAASELDDGTFELVCTLPDQDPTFEGRHAVDFEMRQITSALLSLCREAEETLTVVSPYLESTGVEWLLPGIRGALKRGVTVRLISRELTRGEPNLDALEELYSRAAESGGDLTVYDYYEPDPDSDRPKYTLHSKIVLVDDRAAYVGSANFTRYGFAENLEIGTVLRGRNVRRLGELFDQLVSGSATEVYST